MHARAVDPEDRLGLEGGVEPAALGDLLDLALQGDQLIGRLERALGREVELMLAGGDFVMAVFDHDSQGVERAHYFLADFGAQVERVVEVTGAIVGQRLQPPVRPLGCEQEEFQLDAHRISESQLGRLGQCAGQHSAWIAIEALAVGGVNVADDLGVDSRGGVGSQAERAQVGLQVHVALEDAREAFHRRAVEPFSVAHGMAQPVGGDGDALYRAEHIDELQIEEAGTLLLEQLRGPLQGQRRMPASGAGASGVAVSLSLRRRGPLDVRSAGPWVSARTDRDADDRPAATASRWARSGDAYPWSAPLCWKCGAAAC